MKKAARYLRFSNDGQSQHSIERQDIVTAAWCDHQKVAIIDTFIDEGYSARTFDRPDLKALMSFIRKNYRTIDYLVVAELTRFSREAGDAINLVKQIQLTYGICIVSAGRSCIYDVTDSNSFFMMGLEFLLGNSENIKRQNDINGGIYSAKTNGRWIQGGPAPFGFKKEGEGKNRRLVIHEAEAAIVKFIYSAFLRNTPAYIIKDDARKMGMKRTNNSIIQDILRNPLYMGYQQVKAWKDKPGGLYPLKNFTPIIDEVSWYMVQEKFKPRPRVAITENFPLRGLLKCWCGRCLTGAPSRNGAGNYINYYKCQHSGHNNINAVKAHEQLEEILNLLSLPAIAVRRMEQRSEQIMADRLKESSAIMLQKKTTLEAVETKLHSIEEKFIANQLSFESYDKWHRQLREDRIQLRASIQELEKHGEQVYFLLKNNLRRLTDLRSLYTGAATADKQELLRQVFDNRLYYRQRAYRTPFLMPAFHHNINILKQKQLLFIDDMNEESGDVEAISLLSNRFVELISFISSVRVA